MDQALSAEPHQLRLLVAPSREGGRPLRCPIECSHFLAPVHGAASDDSRHHRCVQPGWKHLDEGLVEQSKAIVESLQAQQRAALTVLCEGNEVTGFVPPADLLGGPRHIERVRIAAARVVSACHR